MTYTVLNKLICDDLASNVIFPEPTIGVYEINISFKLFNLFKSTILFFLSYAFISTDFPVVE